MEKLSGTKKRVTPLELNALPENDLLQHLDWISDNLPQRRLVEIPLLKEGRALVAGDTHGDWPTIQALAEKYLEGGESVGRLILLGDYVDRTPKERRNESLVNALYVLSLSSAYPDRFLALRGNHEAYRHITFSQYEIREEAFQRWGNTAVGERIEELFERLPLAATTESGAYLAHAGFPFTASWRESILRPTEPTWREMLWNDVDLSPLCGRRGIDQPPIDEVRLKGFLQNSGAKVFLRGHDPYVAGKMLYGERLLTLHTTRAYDDNHRFVAFFPLDETLRDLSAVRIVQPPFSSP